MPLDDELLEPDEELLEDEELLLELDELLDDKLPEEEEEELELVEPDEEDDFPELDDDDELLEELEPVPPHAARRLNRVVIARARETDPILEKFIFALVRENYLEFMFGRLNFGAE